MSEKIKFTDEEIKQVNEFQKQYNEIVIKLGQIDVSLLSLEKQKEETIALYKKIQEEQAIFSEKLKNIYGEGVLNPQTGEFTPYQTDQSQQPLNSDIIPGNISN